MQGMNIKGVVTGIIFIVLFLVIFGIIVTQADTLWTAVQASSYNYTGLTQIIALIPLLVLLGGMGFGGWTIYEGVRGRGGEWNLKGMMAGVLVIFVFLILFGLVVTSTDTIRTAVAALTHTFTGLDNILSLVPLLALLGGMGFGGWMVFRSVRGESAVPRRRRMSYARR